MNDEEYNNIKEISNNLDNDVLTLFWQFTIQTLGELEIVSNQHLSIEMFLLRLIHLKSFKPKSETSLSSEDIIDKKDKDQTNVPSQKINKETINQIKNVSQEKKKN